MVQHKTSDQYLTSGKVPTRSIHGFRTYRLLKNFNILSNVDADANADADAVVTAIALPLLSYRRAKNYIPLGINKGVVSDMQNATKFDAKEISAFVKKDSSSQYKALPFGMKNHFSV